MSSFVSRWVVSQDHPVAPELVDPNGVLRDDVVSGWIVDARNEYLDQCRELRERRAAGLLLRFRPSALPAGVFAGNPTSMTVSAGATEFFPTSFTMAFRVRAYGAADDTVVNATCAVSLEDPHTGEAQELGDAVRDELIALEHAARHVN